MLCQKLRITLDTNTLPVDRALEALGDIPADVVVTTVTLREVHGTKWQPELSILQVPEIWVMGESPMGVGALGRPADAEVFEAVLDAISHGTFPKPGKRENVSHGHRNQLRDAAIFATHVRDRRDLR
jgi:hypothetical protein